MNVVIYSRVSSQSARQSTERQVVDLERFAAGRGYEVTAVFEEKISGRKANIERPVLSRPGSRSSADGCDQTDKCLHGPPGQPAPVLPDQT